MNIGVLLFHEVNELEVVGPYTVLNTAKAFLPGADGFDLFTVAKSRNSVQTSADMTITPTWAFMSAPPVDVLIVPGGRGVETALRDRALTQYLSAQKETIKIIVSISSGALLLGSLGYLKDQIVTTHPELYERVEDYEVLRVSEDRLVKNESGVWCSGGSVTGIEVGLELVRYLLGDDLQTKVAKHLAIATTQPSLF